MTDTNPSPTNGSAATTMTLPDVTLAQQKADGLRALANLVETNEDLAEKIALGTLLAIIGYTPAESQRALLERWIQQGLAHGATVAENPESTIVSPGQVEVLISWGPVSVRVWADREAVAEQVVVGTEVVDKVEWRIPALGVETAQAVTA